ncbi:hypothetical protein LNY03_28960, partial [Pseudomonas nitroreducens]|nr:hypothetical protein [Pseudomonas nitroreducens]
FYSRFGLDSVDGQGAILKSVVDPGCDWYETAFTSFEYLFRDEVLLCAGVARVDDVVGHEWSHGVSRYSANFASRGEPGVLSESLSDV